MWDCQYKIVIRFTNHYRAFVDISSQCQLKYFAMVPSWVYFTRSTSVLYGIWDIQHPYSPVRSSLGVLIIKISKQALLLAADRIRTLLASGVFSVKVSAMLGKSCSNDRILCHSNLILARFRRFFRLGVPFQHNSVIFNISTPDIEHECQSSILGDFIVILSSYDGSHTAMHILHVLYWTTYRLVCSSSFC